MPTLSRPTALTLVFFSGATGLLYEFCWSKRLANFLGNTGQAHAILLATFMGGLALGAWLFGRRADRSARPLRLYGALEIGVGLLALLFPPSSTSRARSTCRWARRAATSRAWRWRR